MIIIYNTTINGDTECTCTVVACEFEGDNSLRNEIRVHTDRCSMLLASILATVSIIRTSNVDDIPSAPGPKW